MRYRVLLSAYSCEPGRGSEPEVGWRWATHLAKLHEVTVVTRANNRSVIEATLNRLPAERPRFEYFDLPHPFLWAKKLGLPVAIYYALWQLGLRVAYRKRLKDFDLVHHITFNSFRQPGCWWRCGSVPVVLGPLGGGQICPWKLFGLMRGRRFAELLRSLSVMASPALPQIYASFSAAAKILVANHDTADRIPSRFRDKVVHMLETGIPEEMIAPERSRFEGKPLRVLWLSWLIPIKAPELAIRSFAQARLQNPDLTLTMAGDGPLKHRLQSLAHELGAGPHVTWKGRVSRSELLPLMAEHDVFMFTSLRDTSGNVLLEAMAAGLPCITLLHQGAAEIATDDTARRIPVTTTDETITGLAEAILFFAGSSEACRRMGASGLARIREHYAWEKKAGAMSELYSQVLS